jgi:hypothetical protein
VSIVARGVSLFAGEGFGIEGVYGDIVGLDPSTGSGESRLDHRKLGSTTGNGLDHQELAGHSSRDRRSGVT